MQRKVNFALLEAEQEVSAKLLAGYKKKKMRFGRINYPAQFLQEEEQTLSKTDLNQDQREMERTTIGKAILFVKREIERIQCHKGDNGTMDSNSALGIEAVCRDDMVLMVGNKSQI